MNHPFIKYGQAIVCAEHNLLKTDEIENSHIRQTLGSCMETFRCIPSETFEGKEKIIYCYTNDDDVAGINKKPEVGIYLSSHVITSDGTAATTWKYAKEVCELLEKNKNKTFGALNATTPTAGDYMKFTETGGTTKTNANLSLQEIAFSLITVMTPNKPSLYLWNESSNFCLIPDFPKNEQFIDFIQFFKVMYFTKEKDFLVGSVSPPVNNKRKTYKPNRPKIFAGNFPNAPKSFSLGSVALLGAIGEFSKESQYSERAKRVLENLKEATMYQIKSGKAKTFSYNHHVIDLAKAGKLRTIVDSIYYSQLYQYGRRNRTDLKPQDKKALIAEYQKFDLFASRFLQLFNHSAFRDFLSFRAEYPNEISILFNTYFTKMEKIDPKIVLSAQALGKWLNKVAYFTAKAEVKEKSSDYWEELRRIKSKVLVELESSTFSAKTGDALIAQAIARAGRLSGLDAPQEAALYMVKTASGELPLENAKNLLIAFSRLASNEETHGTFKESDEGENEKEDEELESTDYNDI